MTSVIYSFGRYLPHYRITSETIARAWEREKDHAKGLGILEKTVNAPDEDTFTMALEASKQAIELSGIDSHQINGLFVGSESHPYAVKPTSGMLVPALKLNPMSHAADLEFACKAGTAAMQIVMSMVNAKQITCGLAIGSDNAQGKPGDALEYSAASGAAAFLIGKPSKQHPGLCSLDATLSYTTDTPDFWRNEGEEYPTHAGRFTGEPAYFHHMEIATKAMMEKMSMTPKEIDHVVFHMPNGKFPMEAAKRLGFSKEQMATGFIVPMIGNTYSACSPLGLTFVLEKAKKDERILLVSYGSGAGSDAFVMTMLKDGEPLPVFQKQNTYLTYHQYVQHKEKEHA